MRMSQIDKALANLRAERAVLDLAIRKLEAETTLPAQRTAKPRKGKAPVGDPTA